MSGGEEDLKAHLNAKDHNRLMAPLWRSAAIYPLPR